VAILAAACVGLLGVGMMFHKHQQHLNRLLSAREAFIAAIPADSLVIDHGPLRKLFGVPVKLPKYRWHSLAYQDTTRVVPGDVSIGRERTPWFLAVLSSGEGQPLPAAARVLIDHYGMTPVPSRESCLSLYTIRARAVIR
jgi:hypothetical protein